MRISKHAEDRMKERLGLNRRAGRRHIEKVLQYGLTPDKYGIKAVKNRFVGYQECNPEHVYLVYNDFLYVFGKDSAGEAIMITMYDPMTVMRQEDRYVRGKLSRGKEIQAW